MRQRIIACQYPGALFLASGDVTYRQEVPDMAQFGAVMTLLLAVLLLVLAIAWIWMPVMLAGVRANTRELIAQQARTNELLEALLQRGVPQLPPGA